MTVGRIHTNFIFFVTNYVNLKTNFIDKYVFICVKGNVFALFRGGKILYIDIKISHTGQLMPQNVMYFA